MDRARLFADVLMPFPFPLQRAVTAFTISMSRGKATRCVYEERTRREDGGGSVAVPMPRFAVLLLVRDMFTPALAPPASPMSSFSARWPEAAPCRPSRSAQALATREWFTQSNIGECCAVPAQSAGRRRDMWSYGDEYADVHR